MSLKFNVPQIAITPEAEEDDDNSFLNLAEALTDIEELFEDCLSSRRHSIKKKLKLKVKVSDNDGYNTALEDIEASDEEDNVTLKWHDRPIALDNIINMDQYSAEENYEIMNNNTENPHCLNMHSYISNENNHRRNINEIQTNILPVTDVEEYDTENEYDIETEFPESTLELDNSESNQTVDISDGIQDNPPFSEQTQNVERTVKDITCKPANSDKPRKKAPTFTQMMKGRTKSTEHKMRRKRRNKTNSRKSNGNEQNEESESSDTEWSDIKIKKNCKYSNSLNYESDMEDDARLPFPLCKRTFTKRKNTLQMPEFNANDITDVEDVECDIDVSRKRLSIDSVVFQKQLDEMASCYSFTKDKNESKQNSEEEDEIREPKRNTEFSPKRAKNKPPNENENHLLVQTSGGGGTTDVENLGSSSENEDNVSEAEIGNSSDTEKLVFDDYEESDFADYPDIVLPPAIRMLVIAEENKCLIPTMRILPLEDNSDSESGNDSCPTEDESFISIELLSPSGECRNLLSPQLPFCEPFLINVSEESIHSIPAKFLIDEEHTDVEDLSSSNKLTKAEKNENEQRYLSVNGHTPSNELTDVEDLDMDMESADKSLLSVPFLYVDNYTDVENLESDEEPIMTESDQRYKNKQFQKYSLAKEIPSRYTDTEDIAASSDDEITYCTTTPATPCILRNELDQVSSIEVNIENSSRIDFSAPEEVMYLKGGGFQEIFTDTEELLDDVEGQVVEVMEAWEYFNPFDGENMNRTGTGDDSSKSSGSRDVSMLKDPSHLPEDNQTRQPVDQHQLSEEMKELLKEIAESNKQ